MKRQRTLREDIANEVIEDFPSYKEALGTHDMYGAVLPAAFNGAVVAWGDLDDDGGNRKIVCLTVNDWRKETWLKGDGAVFLQIVPPSQKEDFLAQKMLRNGIRNVQRIYEEMEEYKYAGWYMYTRLFFDWGPISIVWVSNLWKLLVQRKSKTAAWVLVCTHGTVERQRLLRWEVICFGVSYLTTLPILYVVSQDKENGLVLLKK